MNDTSKEGFGWSIISKHDVLYKDLMIVQQGVKKKAGSAGASLLIRELWFFTFGYKVVLHGIRCTVYELG